VGLAPSEGLRGLLREEPGQVKKTPITLASNVLLNVGHRARHYLS